MFVNKPTRDQYELLIIDSLISEGSLLLILFYTNLTYKNRKYLLWSINSLLILLSYTFIIIITLIMNFIMDTIFTF